jgi:hypothetical protein
MTMKSEWPCYNEDSVQGVDGLQDCVGLQFMFENEAPKMFHKNLVEIETCSITPNGTTLSIRTRKSKKLLIANG